MPKMHYFVLKQPIGRHKTDIFLVLSVNGTCHVFQQVKFTDKFCISDFVNTAVDWIRICFVNNEPQSFIAYNSPYKLRTHSITSTTYSEITNAIEANT